MCLPHAYLVSRKNTALVILLNGLLFITVCANKIIVIIHWELLQ